MNKFTGHTEGPWYVELSQLHPASPREGYTIVTRAFDVVSGHLAIRREEDAILISAAPDLLAAVNTALMHMIGYVHPTDAERELIAVLRKALQEEEG